MDKKPYMVHGVYAHLCRACVNLRRAVYVYGVWCTEKVKVYVCVYGVVHVYMHDVWCMSVYGMWCMSMCLVCGVCVHV